MLAEVIRRIDQRRYLYCVVKGKRPTFGVLYEEGGDNVLKERAMKKVKMVSVGSISLVQVGKSARRGREETLREAFTILVASTEIPHTTPPRIGFANSQTVLFFQGSSSRGAMERAQLRPTSVTTVVFPACRAAPSTAYDKGKRQFRVTGAWAAFTCKFIRSCASRLGG